MDVAEKITGFIREEVVLDRRCFARRTMRRCSKASLIRFALMQLVAFLEEEYDTEIDDTDVTAENFRTIADIARLVDRRRASA